MTYFGMMRVYSMRKGQCLPTKMAFSLIEVLIGLVLLSFLIAVSFSMFGLFSSKRVGLASARLILQMEARKAFVDLYQQIQGGAEVLKPDPGATMPFLMLRNLSNDLIVLFLRKDVKATQEEGEDRFTLYSIVYDIEKGTPSEPRQVLGKLHHLDFTTHGFGAVLITGSMKDKESSFSFVNMIHLKNTESEDS